MGEIASRNGRTGCGRLHHDDAIVGVGAGGELPIGDKLIGRGDGIVGESTCIIKIMGSADMISIIIRIGHIRIDIGAGPL